jgi:hypothetical protein
VTFLFYAAAALYPVLVFCGLVLFRFPLRLVSLAVAAFGLLFFIVMTGAKKKARIRPCSLPRLACSVS